MEKDHFSDKNRILDRGSGIDADHVLFQRCIVGRVPPKQCVSENIFATDPENVSFIRGARAGLIGEKNRLWLAFFP